MKSRRLALLKASYFVANVSNWLTCHKLADSYAIEHTADTIAYIWARGVNAVLVHRAVELVGFTLVYVYSKERL